MKYRIVLEIDENYFFPLLKDHIAHKIRLVGVDKINPRLQGEGSIPAKEALDGEILAPAPSAMKTGKQMLLYVMEAEPRIFDRQELLNIYTRNGRSSGSLNHDLYDLIKEKKIRSLGRGKYMIPGTVTVKMGATA